MERRKVLLGLGSLAAGGAAAMGTGAFSQATVEDRSVNVAVAPDDQSFLGLDTSYSGLENSEYATQTSEGKLKLRFNENAGNPGGGFLNEGATGLNPDSEYYFDDVFAIEAANKFNDYKNVIGITIEENLDNPDNIRFYWRVGNAGGRETDLANGTVGLSAGTYATIGVYVETPEDLPANPATWESGSITIQATDVDPSDG